MTHVNPSDDQLREILAATRTIAVVGASSKPDRPSYGIMKILLGAGYDVIPVTPRETRVLGRTAFPSLADIRERVDIVDVFRRPEETPDIADEAVDIGAKVLWLQLGITSDEAAERARHGGLTVVMDKCLGATVQHLGARRATEQDRLASSDRCEHFAQIAGLEPRTPAGCEECLAAGGRWVHLRLCLTCGHVGCCDNSPGRHATAHYHHTQDPLIQSLEPEEDWAWCYPDEVFIA